ncbi:MAG: hypothetical protein PHU14_09895 [Methylovulum sp.]|nr:hypothetical protein [Methylovulum sp.]
MVAVTVRVKNHKHAGKRCLYGDKLTLDDDTAAMLAGLGIVSIDIAEPPPSTSATSSTTMVKSNAVKAAVIEQTDKPAGDKNV